LNRFQHYRCKIQATANTNEVGSLNSTVGVRCNTEREMLRALQPQHYAPVVEQSVVSISFIQAARFIKFHLPTKDRILCWRGMCI